MATITRGGGFGQQQQQHQEFPPGPPFEDEAAVVLPAVVSVDYMVLDTEAAAAPVVMPEAFVVEV